MRKLIPTLAALAALLLPAAARADTAQLSLVFLSGIPASASAVRVVITDRNGTPLQAATNAPGGTAFTESSVIPGEYIANYAATYTPANLPLRAEFYLVGTSPLIAAAQTYLDPLPTLPAMRLDLTQPLDLTNKADTVGGGLLAARAQGFGKWVITGTPGSAGATLSLYAADGTTILKTLDVSASGTRQ